MSPNQVNLKSDSTGQKRTSIFENLHWGMTHDEWGIKKIPVKGFYWPSLWLFMIWTQLATIGMDIDRYVTHFVGPIVAK